MAYDATNLARAREIVAQYPRPKSAILPLAHLAQDQDGWLRPEAMREIADLVGVTPAEVNGTCSFYTMFKRTPCGKYVVSVCTNVTCLVLGGPEIHGEGGEVAVVDADDRRPEAHRPGSLLVRVDFDDAVHPEGAGDGEEFADLVVGQH